MIYEFPKYFAPLFPGIIRRDRCDDGWLKDEVPTISKKINKFSDYTSSS